MKNLPKMMNNLKYYDLRFLLKNYWIVLCFFAWQGFAQNIPLKPQPARYANDYAGLMSAYDLTLLETKLKAYYDTTSTQIVIVLVNTLEGVKLEEYSHKLAETWGIGQKGKDNGLLILVAKAERQIRIEVGYGMEGLIPDATANHVIQDIIQPQFKEGKYFQGLEEATNKIIGYLKGEFKADQLPKISKDVGAFWGYLFMSYILGIIFGAYLIVSLIEMIYPRYTTHRGNNNNVQRKILLYILVFGIVHTGLMIFHNYFEYLLQIYAGDMLAGFLAYLFYSWNSITGQRNKTYSNRSNRWSSSYSDSSYSDSSSSYSDSSYSDSSSSYSDSSYGGGSFGGGGASGSW